MSTRRFPFLSYRSTLILAAVVSILPLQAAAQDVLEMELSVLEDKIRGGWAGQMVGVAYGAPWEFRCLEEICEGDIEWSPDMVEGALAQDDLQIEMTFAEVMDTVGLDATAEQYGDAFRDTTYLLFHANASARRNLNNGLKPPMSGHPKNNLHANDIDFQIEADFIGMMCPGMPQVAIELSDRIGHVMNYGDGVYGGTFVSCMYAAAFFETDVQKVVEAGVACLPKGSGYRAIIEDVLAAHEEHPDDWREGWRIISKKWDKQDPCPEGALLPFNIDARLNGAFIALGLLYGQGDMEKTLEIATRSGQDADCNPANAAGVLGLMYGFEALDEKWVGNIEDMSEKKFVGTNYSFNDIVASTHGRALEAVRRSGGEVRNDSFTLPKQTPVPPTLEQWSPGIPVKSYDHDDPAWTWTGDWEEEKDTAYAALAGKVSHSAGNVAELAFSGTAIGLVGYATTNGGMADIFLDGEKAGTVNAYIGPGTFEQDLWRAYDLEDGPHTLRIVTLDKHDPRMEDTCRPSAGMGATDDRPKRFPIHRAVAYRPEEAVSKKTSAAESSDKEGQFRRLPVSEYVDKMKAGWVGQMVGVGWGAPTEFRWRSEIIPEDEVPKWKPEMVNQFGQDDIYVEMTFIRSLEEHGAEVPIRQAGIDFANSGYMLWHANKAGRDLLREGIAPPDSGHPEFNTHADDIDYQIEADFSGLISPGLPNEVVRLGKIFGRLMNYGDGLYGGQFVGCMYAEAFFEDDIQKIVAAGLECIPEESRYAETIRDVVKWHGENPNDWQRTWQLIEDKYQANPDNRLFSCSQGAFNIDAKINGAYIVMGMLYGEGDIEDTVVISMRGGQDSDCNPANALGVLSTTMGLEAMPDEYKSALDESTKFSHTEYDFAGLTKVSIDLVRSQVLRAGGWVEKNDAGEEVFVIPVRPVQPSALEQSWEPGPSAGSKFTEDEMAKINPPEESETSLTVGMVDISKDVEEFAPGWSIKACGDHMDPGLHAEVDGRANVLITHPVSKEEPAVLYREYAVPEGTRAVLHLEVGHDPDGDWQLGVNAGQDRLLSKSISSALTQDGWVDFTFDLSDYAGDNIWLVLTNDANEGDNEAARWARIEIVTE